MDGSLLSRREINIIFSTCQGLERCDHLINKWTSRLTIIDAFRLLSRETAIKALRAAIAKGGKNRLDFVKLEAYAKELRFDITPYLLSVTT
jgi:hypothetical protein